MDLCCPNPLCPDGGAPKLRPKCLFVTWACERCACVLREFPSWASSTVRSRS